MNWTKLFVPGHDLSVEKAKEYMATRDATTYQLLDVRQPAEYEQGHLAGARLIPLKELLGRFRELEKGKPVLVYCAVGGRSKVAARVLSGLGFAHVYNIAGGIKAWQGGEDNGSGTAGIEK